MKITEINMYGEGYYSGSSEEENLLVTTEFYNKFLKDKVENRLMETGICLGELDGKHSEVYGEIGFIHYDNDKELVSRHKPENDNNSLRDEIFDICGTRENSKIATNYYNNLPKPIKLSLTINSKYKDSVLEVIKELEEKYK
ncbi:MAG: hypothetical protein RSC24_06380 [Clostridium sp.]